jgi:hypothetical protein
MPSSVVCITNVANEGQRLSWPEIKCTRYKKAWSDAIALRGRQGLRAEFLERHDAFLSSGCLIRANVCPQTDEEMHIVAMMEVAVVNAGIAGTFLPFICRTRPSGEVGS